MTDNRYGFNQGKAALQALGATIEALPPQRVVPPNGRAYTRRNYRVTTEETGPRMIDMLTIRMMSFLEDAEIMHALHDAPLMCGHWETIQEPAA